MKKLLIALFVTVATLSAAPSPSAAQGWEMIAGWVAEKGLREAVKFSGLDCIPVSVDGGRWWYVYYEDGYIVANRFRSCRDYDDIYDHVIEGRGDCDWVDAYGGRVCFDSLGRARRLVQEHGPISDIQHN